MAKYPWRKNIFLHHQEGREGHENSQNGVLEEIGCWWGVCHPNLTYDTFLESSGPGQCTGSINFCCWHHQDDQEGQECPINGVLEENGCLDGVFAILTSLMIPFLESSGPGQCTRSINFCCWHHQDDQEGQECPLNGVLEEIGCLDGGFAILTSHDTFLESSVN